MIQFNLLPDVKLEYIKSQRARRLVMTVAVLVTGLAVALLLVLLSINGLQKNHLSALSDDIDKESKQLQREKQIDRVLTVQNQLESLTDLHEKKPAAARLFNYLNKVTPNQVGISNVEVVFADQTMAITGSADALSSVNKYVDTLKFTSYTVDGEVADKAFNDVVLAAFGLGENNNDPAQAATYTITLSYDETIFDITQKVDLVVPNLTTTRSEAESPTELFQPAPEEEQSTEGGNN